MNYRSFHFKKILWLHSMTLNWCTLCRVSFYFLIHRCNWCDPSISVQLCDVKMRTWKRRLSFGWSFYGKMVQWNKDSSNLRHSSNCPNFWIWKIPPPPPPPPPPHLELLSMGFVFYECFWENTPCGKASPVIERSLSSLVDVLAWCLRDAKPLTQPELCILEKIHLVMLVRGPTNRILVHNKRL